MNADVPALMSVEGNLQLLKDLSLLRSFSELDLFHLDQENLLYSALKLWIDNIGVESGCVCLRDGKEWLPIASLSWDLDAGYLRSSPAFLQKLTEDTSLLDSEASEASLVSRQEGGLSPAATALQSAGAGHAWTVPFTARIPARGAPAAWRDLCQSAGARHAVRAHGP